MEYAAVQRHGPSLGLSFHAEVLAKHRLRINKQSAFSNDSSAVQTAIVRAALVLHIPLHLNQVRFVAFHRTQTDKDVNYTKEQYLQSDCQEYSSGAQAKHARCGKEGDSSVQSGHNHVPHHGEQSEGFRE